jgi:hypothetical protein
VPAFWDHSFSPCSGVITGMLKEVVWKLRNHPLAQVNFPDCARMREFADMVQLRALLVKDIIRFMDSISFPGECTNKRVEKMPTIADRTATQWRITCLPMPPMVRYSLQQSTFRGVGQTALWWLGFCITRRQRLGTSKSESTRDSLGVAKLTGCLLGQ